MKYCSHIEEFSTSLSSASQYIGDNSLVNQNSLLEDRIEKICSLLISLNINQKKSQADQDTESKYRGCQGCINSFQSPYATKDSVLYKRLQLCAECFYLGCFNYLNDFSHMKQHAVDNNHSIVFDVVYGSIYCIQCRDFQYNQIIEDLVKKCYLKENFLPHGMSFMNKRVSYKLI